MINHFPDAGIRLASPENGGGFTITGNMIGNDGNESRANGDGILILSADNTVGGTTPDTYNVISGNTYAGIRIVAPNNRVLGNLIGVDYDGVRELGNGVGIVVSGASNNLIGAENHLRQCHQLQPYVWHSCGRQCYRQSIAAQPYVRQHGIRH